MTQHMGGGLAAVEQALIRERLKKFSDVQWAVRHPALERTSPWWDRSREVARLRRQQMDEPEPGGRIPGFHKRIQHGQDAVVVAPARPVIA